MNRLAVTFCLVFIMLPAAASAHVAPASPKEWTVLVYMNGKNSLEQAAIGDFDEMAVVGSTQDVDVVVQLGRLGDVDMPTAGNWAGVRRFHVKKGDHARAEMALEEVTENGKSVDMGSSATLSDFLSWGSNAFPAKHMMVVIWNHGQGWRLRAMSAGDPTPKTPSSANTQATALRGFRSVSNDDEFRSVIYNADVAEGLSKGLGKPVDILAFDACLMAMIETAYEMRLAATYVVGSEELEPGAGWDYTMFLTRLTSSPRSDPRDVAKIAVQSYADSHSDYEQTTQSAIDTSQIAPLVGALSNLTDKITNKDIKAAQRARTDLPTYATDSFPDWKSSVDLGTWLEKFHKEVSPKSPAASSAEEVRRILSAAVVANYQSVRMQNNHNSTGLAIFFPENAADFSADPEHDGYKKHNTFKPVAFVQDSTWPQFLKRAFNLPTE